MKFSPTNAVKILSETSFLLALSLPIVKTYLSSSLVNINLLYLVIYTQMILGITHLIPKRKLRSEYLAGLAVFMLFTLYTCVTSNEISPSILSFFIICFGRPFWQLNIKSIRLYIFSICILIILSFSTKNNILEILNQVLLPGQNYLSALIFSVTYLILFFNQHNSFKAVTQASLGTILLFIVKSRTSVLSLLPMCFQLVKRLNKITTTLLIMTSLTLVWYVNPFVSLFYKYSEDSLLSGFFQTRGNVWIVSLDYALQNLLAPLQYTSMTTDYKRSILGASSSHNWFLENILAFGLLGFISIYLTCTALLRNFALFLPLFIFSMLEPSIFFTSNIVSYLFLTFLISHSQVRIGRYQ